MPGKGRRVWFYGSFKSKAKAVARESAGRGRHILKRRVRRQGVRFIVVKER